LADKINNLQYNDKEYRTYSLNGKDRPGFQKDETAKRNFIL